MVLEVDGQTDRHTDKTELKAGGQERLWVTYILYRLYCKQEVKDI